MLIVVIVVWIPICLHLKQETLHSYITISTSPFILTILKYSALKKKSVNLYTRDICGNGYIVVYHLGEFLLILDTDSSKHTKTTETNRKPSLVQSRIRTVLPRKWLFTDILLGATKAYCLYDLLYIQKFPFLRETMVTTVGPDKTMKSHTPF